MTIEHIENHSMTKDEMMMLYTQIDHFLYDNKNIQNAFETKKFLDKCVLGKIPMPEIEEISTPSLFGISDDENGIGLILKWKKQFSNNNESVFVVQACKGESISENDPELNRLCVEVFAKHNQKCRLAFLENVLNRDHFSETWHNFHKKSKNDSFDEHPLNFRII